MKHQALFSSKDKSKNLKCRLLQFVFGALRVKYFKLLKCSDVNDYVAKSDTKLWKYDCTELQLLCQ